MEDETSEEEIIYGLYGEGWIEASEEQFGATNTLRWNRKKQQEADDKDNEWTGYGDDY